MEQDCVVRNWLSPRANVSAGRRSGARGGGAAWRRAPWEGPVAQRGQIRPARPAFLSPAEPLSEPQPRGLAPHPARGRGAWWARGRPRAPLIRVCSPPGLGSGTPAAPCSGSRGAPRRPRSSSRSCADGKRPAPALPRRPRGAGPHPGGARGPRTLRGPRASGHVRLRRALPARVPLGCASRSREPSGSRPCAPRSPEAAGGAEHDPEAPPRARRLGRPSCCLNDAGSWGGMVTWGGGEQAGDPGQAPPRGRGVSRRPRSCGRGDPRSPIRQDQIQPRGGSWGRQGPPGGTGAAGGRGARARCPPRCRARRFSGRRWLLPAIPRGRRRSPRPSRPPPR